MTSLIWVSVESQNPRLEPKLRPRKLLRDRCRGPPRRTRTATARSFSRLARHEVRDRLDVVLGHRIAGLRHGDAAAPTALTVLLIVQGLGLRRAVASAQPRHIM